MNNNFTMYLYYNNIRERKIMSSIHLSKRYILLKI